MPDTGARWPVVAQRADGSWQIEIPGGPAFLTLTPAAMGYLVRGMVAAGLVAQAPVRRRP